MSCPWRVHLSDMTMLITVLRLYAELVGDIHSQKLKMFMEEYDDQLREIRDAIDANLTDAWDCQKEPFTMDLEPCEMTPISELAKTENKTFSQILEVFVGLCEEMNVLINEVRSRMFHTGVIFRLKLHTMDHWHCMVLSQRTAR